MPRIGIVGSGPKQLLPDLKQYEEKIDFWIGVDRGAIEILREKLPLHYAIGDFDSVDDMERGYIQDKAREFDQHPAEKNETDLELGLEKAMSLKPKEIYLFGVTGGRLDHELINIQQLLAIKQNNIDGFIVDTKNLIQIAIPGNHIISKDDKYPYISFIPFSEKVENITLNGFYYPLSEETIHYGSTLCLSNELVSNNGTFFFENGILLVIKSRD